MFSSSIKFVCSKYTPEGEYMTFKRCDELLNLHQTLWVVCVSALILSILVPVVLYFWRKN